MNTLTSPSGASTEDDNQQQTGSPPAVNPVQASLSSQDPRVAQLEAQLAQYEQRHRALMSDKDKAINERNQAITAQADLQQQLTDLRSTSSESLNSTAQAAQMALDEAKTLRAQVQSLQGEVLRGRMLQEHAELLPYSEFLPATTDEQALKDMVARLKEIRQKDLEQNRTPLHQYTQQQQSSSSPGQSPTTTNPYALYQNRPTMAPGLTSAPPSSPAQMHPAGAGNTAGSIDQMLREARASNDPAKFEDAVQRAALLAKQSVDAQLGRGGGQ